MVAQATQFRRARQKGQELIEFTLMVFVILGFFSLIIDISWMVFTRATLQYAVREGCRWAVANGYDNPSIVVPNPGNIASYEQPLIQAQVVATSMGFLNSSTPLCSGAITSTTPLCININWYAPSALNTPLSITATPPPNQSPNVVEVDVVNFKQTPLLGIFIEKSIHTFTFNAGSADVME
jgi:hypothetical protein